RGIQHDQPSEAQVSPDDDERDLGSRFSRAVVVLRPGFRGPARQSPRNDRIGKDLVVVFNGQTSLQAGGERAGQNIQLEMRDYDALVDGVPAIKSISPEVRRRMTLGAGYRSRDYT